MQNDINAQNRLTQYAGKITIYALTQTSVHTYLIRK